MGADSASGRTAFVAIGLTVAVIVVAVAVVGGFGGSTTVEFADESFDADEISDTPLIVAHHQSGGFRVFGIEINSPDHWLSVGVAPPRECIRSDDRGSEVLIGEGICGQYASLAGPVLGSGTTADGVRWVELWVPVSHECFRATTVGERWPVSSDTCE